MAVVWLLVFAVAAGVAQQLYLLIVVAIATLVGGCCRSCFRYPSVVFFLLACACGANGWSSSARLARDRACFEHASAAAGSALVSLEGMVTSFPQTGLHGTSFEFATVLEERRVQLQIRAERFDVAYGDRYRVRARLLNSTPAGLRFLASRGLAGSARVRYSEMSLAGRGGNIVVRECFWPLHRFVRTRLSRALGGDAGLAIGMLLGERGQIDEPVRDAVRRLGITHLLAISGMHLTTIAACVMLLVRMWPRRRAQVLLLSLSAYTAMVGGVESLTRAYLMALVLLAAHATVRPLRAIDALGKALFVMALAVPLSLRSVGLQLSFAATFAVLCCLPAKSHAREHHGARQHVRRALGSVRTAFLLSIAVELFIAPLQLYHFHMLSAVGPVATVVFFVPVTLVLLGAAPVAALTAFLPAGEWPGSVLGAMTTWTNELIVACGRLAPAPLEISGPSPWLYYGGLFLGWRLRRRPAAWALAGALMATAFLC